MWMLISLIRGQSTVRPLVTRFPRGTNLGSQILIRTTNPDLRSRTSVTSERYAGWQDDPPVLVGAGFHGTVSLISWHVISGSTKAVFANTNRIIQGADFGVFPWLIGCELTCFLRPSCCLLVTVITIISTCWGEAVHWAVHRIGECNQKPVENPAKASFSGLQSMHDTARRRVDHCSLVLLEIQTTAHTRHGRMLYHLVYICISTH